MMQNRKWTLILSSVVILLPVLAGLLLWNQLPARMATHWGLDGTADGWSGRPFAVFGMPLMLLATHWLCIFITAKDPKNKSQSRKAVGMVFWICPVISLMTSGITYLLALGKELHAGMLVVCAVGLPFIIIGNYLPKCKQNHTIGVRVKWSLENEENWNATHRMAGKLWVLGGIACLLCVFLPEKLAVTASLILVLVISFVPVVYSYLYYKRQRREGTAKLTPTPKGKYHKALTIGSLIFTAVTLLFVGVLCFTGEIAVKYEADSFTVEASYWDDLTVEYEAIDSIAYQEDFEAGMRIFGFGSPRLSMGTFKSDAFGQYTLYAYTRCKAGVVMTVQGKTLVISGIDTDETRAIYEELLTRVP